MTLAGFPAKTVKGGTSCHNRPSSNRASLPNLDARQKSCAASNPHILTNGHALSRLRALPTLSSLRVNGQGGSVDADVRTEHSVVANRNLAHIIDSAVAADGDVVAHNDVVPIVALEWGFYCAVAANSPNIGDRGCLRWGHADWIPGLQNLPEQPRALLGGYSVRRRRQVVEAPTGAGTSLALEAQFLVEGVEEAAIEHLFLLCALMGVS